MKELKKLKEVTMSELFAKGMEIFERKRNLKYAKGIFTTMERIINPKNAKRKKNKSGIAITKNLLNPKPFLGCFLIKLRPCNS